MDEKAESPLWSNEFEYTAKKQAIQEVLDRGEARKGFLQLEELQKELERLFEETGHWRYYLLELLLIKNNLLKNAVFTKSVSPTLRLQVLDRIYELSQGIDGWNVKGGRGDFWTSLRKALDMRKRLRKGV